MEPGVSVIICCYNGADRIPDTIRHLAAQQVPQDVPWEILLIDNASTDDTATIAASEWRQYGSEAISFKVLQQPIPGKNHAYKLGVTNAGFEYLLTVDDDNRLEPGYIERVYKRMNADPGIGVLGGCGKIDPEQPAWPEIATYRSSYVNGPQTWAAADHWVYGAGSACRTSVLLKFYEHHWQQATSGRLGTQLICGEDVEICLMFYLCGYKIVADDLLTFDHFVPLKRQTLAYLLNLEYWLSYSNVLLNNYVMLIDEDGRPVRKKLWRWYKRTIKDLIALYAILARQRLAGFQRPDDAQKLKVRSYRGILSSIKENKVKLIRHHEHLKSVLDSLRTETP